MPNKVKIINAKGADKTKMDKILRILEIPDREKTVSLFLKKIQCSTNYVV